jgi:hypothetical protein
VNNFPTPGWEKLYGHITQESTQCDYPVDPEKRAKEGRCTNTGYTELVIKDTHTGKNVHMLWLCRKHSHTKKTTIVADGEQHDESCYRVEPD